MHAGLKDFLTGFLREYCTLNPIIGSHLGLEEYDTMMPDGSKESRNARLRFFGAARDKLLSLQKEPLAFEEEIS